MDNLLKALDTISPAISLLPLAAALVKYRHIAGYLKPLFVLIILSAIVEITAYTFLIFHIQANLLYLVYTYLELTLISLFYKKFFQPYFNTSVFTFVIFIFIAVSAIFYSRLSFGRADHYSIALESFIFIFYSLFLFYFSLKNLLFENLLASPAFWINTGILFYFAGNLIIFIFSSYIAEHLNNAYSLLWSSIHTFCNILMNIFFSIGFWKIQEK